MNFNDYFKNKFVRREISVLLKDNGKYIPDKRYIIGVVLDDMILPHPITDFIDKKYYLESGSINSEKAAADILVQFLNFIYKQTSNRNTNFVNVRGIKDLKLVHLENYLEHCGEIGNKRDTVLRKEYYLLQFYYFIGIEKKQLKEKPEIELTTDQYLYSRNRRKRIKSLSANLYYKKPPKESFDSKNIKKKDLVTQQSTNIKDKRNARLLFIREFLLLATKEVPDIAFAICLQIFGGLRAAECMNLSINAIKPQNNSKYGEKGMVVEIRDRQIDLFNPKQPLNNEQVKKTRDQAILIDPLVPFLFKKHSEWLSIKKKSIKHKDFKNEIALFLNNDGQAMRTHTYRSRFNKLKNVYLGILRNTRGRYQDFQEFRNTNWSTHICRGTFTNLCLDSGFNSTQTAIMRGDNSPDAMIEYTDILTATQKITQAINVITDTAINPFEGQEIPETSHKRKE